MSNDDRGDNHRSVYSGGHRITRREARAYASLLEDEIGELRSELEGEYERIQEELNSYRDEAHKIVNQAEREHENGTDIDKVLRRYAPRLESVRNQAEEAIQIEGKTPAEKVQTKIYQKQRWDGIIDSNDRGSTDAQEYSMRTNTVREKFKKMGAELERLKAKYLSQQEFVDYLEGLRNRFPEHLEGRERNIEWTEEELEDIEGDVEEAKELLSGKDDVNDDTFEPGPGPAPAG